MDEDNATNSATRNVEEEDDDILAADSPDGRTRRLALERIWQRNRSKRPQPLSQLTRLSRLGATAAAFDSMERCREMGVKIVVETFEKAEDNDVEIVDIALPTIACRLIDGSEPSEEVRMLLVAALRAMVEKFSKMQAREDGGPVGPERQEAHWELVVEALAVVLLDQHPEAIKDSCSCVCSLAAIARPGGAFSRWADKLVAPLVRTLSHRHARVRAAGVMALGATILRGSSKGFAEVWPHFAQCLLDQSPIVRLAVIEIAGSWISELPDRSSYYPHLISLILTGLSDDVDNVQQLAVRVWHGAGRQYEAENEMELKDQLEYERPFLDGCPGDMVRSPLGCRALVCRNLTCLLPAIFKDLKDWKDDARLKSAHLLYMLLLHAEEAITQHVPVIIHGMVGGCSNDDQQVLRKISDAAYLVGRFVPAGVWHAVILEKLADDASLSNLTVLTAMLRGCSHQDLRAIATTVVLGLLDAVSYHMQSMPHQDQILECVSIILQSLNCHKDTLCPIFHVLVALLSSSDALRHRIYSCFDRIQMFLSIETKDELFTLYGKDFVIYLTTSLPCELWNVHSSQFLMFKTFLIEAGFAAAGSALEDVSAIIASLSQEEKDLEMKFYLFQAISRVMEDLTNTDCCGDFAIRCIRDCVLPNLDWRPGKSASVLRAAAATCLHSLLRHLKGGKNEVKPKLPRMLVALETHKKTAMTVVCEKFVSVFEAVMSKSSGCLADGHGTTRHAACQILDDLMRNHFKLCKPDDFCTLSAKLVEMLDDKQLLVRLAACQALGSCLGSWTATQAFDGQIHGAHMESICSALVLYLDDPEVRFQSATLETLKIVCERQPDIVGAQIEKARIRQKSREHIEALTKSLENVKTS